MRGVSGHNGEHWSAIAGGLGRLLELGDTASAEEAQAAIEAEIDREQAVFDVVSREPGAELDLLRLSMTLAHNRGDLTQGMGFWKRTPLTAPVQEHFSTRGRFEVAVRIYQHTGLSAEGHRHYPLRPVKVLRRSRTGYYARRRPSAAACGYGSGRISSRRRGASWRSLRCWPRWLDPFTCPDDSGARAKGALPAR